MRARAHVRERVHVHTCGFVFVREQCMCVRVHACLCALGTGSVGEWGLCNVTDLLLRCCCCCCCCCSCCCCCCCCCCVFSSLCVCFRACVHVCVHEHVCMHVIVLHWCQRSDDFDMAERNLGQGSPSGGLAYAFEREDFAARCMAARLAGRPQSSWRVVNEASEFVRQAANLLHEYQSFGM